MSETAQGNWPEDVFGPRDIRDVKMITLRVLSELAGPYEFFVPIERDKFLVTATVIGRTVMEMSQTSLMYPLFKSLFQQCMDLYVSDDDIPPCEPLNEVMTDFILKFGDGEEEDDDE